MRITAIFILLLLCSPLALTSTAKPYRRRHPNDSHSVGMSFQAPPAKDGDEFIEGIIGMLLSELTDLHIDSYPVEDGEFKNVDIRVSFPKKEGITFRGDGDSDAMLFKLHGVKADIDTDLDFYSGTVKGNAQIRIDKMDVDLKTTPVSANGEDHMNIQYHLNLKDADISGNINALEGDDDLPSEFNLGLDSILGDINPNFKISAVKMIDDKLEKETQEVLKNYFNGMTSQYSIPRKLDKNVSYSFYNALEPRRYNREC